MATYDPIFGTSGPTEYQRYASGEDGHGGEWTGDGPLVTINGRQYIRTRTADPTILSSFDQFGGGYFYDPTYGWVVPLEVATARTASSEDFIDKYGVALAGAGIGAVTAPAWMSGLEGVTTAGTGDAALAGGAAGDTLGAGGIGYTPGVHDFYGSLAENAGIGSGAATPVLTGSAASAAIPGTGAMTAMGSLPSLSSIGSSALEWIKANPAAAAQIFGTTVQGITSWLASDAQQDAAADANDMIWRMYQQKRADYAPWREAGAGAVNRLVDLTTPGKQFDTMLLDPGYQFRLGEGEKSINRAVASRGNYDSGAALKALTRYGQDYATGEFGNVFNRNALLAGMGQTATGGTVNAGQNAVNTMAGNTVGAGNARASGYVGIGNALNTGINNYQQGQLVNPLMEQMSLQNQLLRRQLGYYT